MPSFSIVRQSRVIRTPRVAQVEGIFDIPLSEESVESWNLQFPIEERDWNIGLIVGPSGCGKSTIAREVFGGAVCEGFSWSRNKTILDDFPKQMGIKAITEILSSVGFSSPPLWLRPFHVLSTGQKMRVEIARLLAEKRPIAVMDEFTSVVDRTVAQIGSAAIAKTVRRQSQKFVAVSCHYDVADWLQPDWVYRPDSNEFLWRFPESRPHIKLEVKRVHHSAWQIFRQYHYLNHTFNKAARCFVAFLRGEPVALQAVLPTPHPKAKNLYRGHRAVCLPDYQGVGIGNRLIEYVASAYRGMGFRILSTTASPSLIRSRQKNKNWKLNVAPHLSPPRSASSSKTLKAWIPAINRLTSTWEYIGEAMPQSDAKELIYGLG